MPGASEIEAMKPDAENQIDWPQALEGVEGDPEALKIVVEAALEECPRCVESIRRAIQEDDAEGLRIAAHTLKSTLRYFGKERAVARAFRLEQLGRAGAPSEGAQLLGPLEADLSDLVEELTVYLQQGTGPTDEAGR